MNMNNRTIMLGILLAVVAGSGAFARAEQSTAPTRALQGAGAAVAGPEEAAIGFEQGKTTLKDIEDAIGEPNTSRIDAGKRTACYRYAGQPTVPESFIRMVGSPSGEADLTCCFSFTENGVLEGVVASVNQTSSALVSVAEEDAKAGRGVACPPRVLKPGTVVHLPFAGSR